MIHPKDMTGWRIDPPCSFIGSNDPLPAGLMRAIEKTAVAADRRLVDDKFQLIRIDLPDLGDGLGDVFLVHDEEGGDSYLARGNVDRCRTVTVGPFSDYGWRSVMENDRKALALRLFVDMCGSGMMHGPSYEDLTDGVGGEPEITKAEYDDLYLAPDERAIARLISILKEKDEIDEDLWA